MAGMNHAQPRPPLRRGARRVAAGSDARYWQLLGIIDGWPAIPSTMPAWEWFTAALRVRG